jgi:hypothetical protein
MKEKFLPWFLLFCALGLSGTAAYYSVIGLSVVFAGVAIPVIIMGTFLEVSKLAIATYLHDKWKETHFALKFYLTTALIVLSIITSIGIYGLLSTGFQENIAKLEINNKKIKNIEIKKSRFVEIKDELTNEKTILDKDITQLRSGLSTNTTTQSVDRNTGQIITRANNANRRSFELQLNEAQTRRDLISNKIDNLNDSITKVDIQILDMESEDISGNELGTIKYVSEILNWEIKKVANLFILILIFVFDPLAITLVIATNQAFRNKKDEDIPIQIEPKVEEIMVKNETTEELGVEEIITDDNPKQVEPEVDETIPEDTPIQIELETEKPEKKIWDKVRELKQEDKLPPDPTEDEIDDEPSALAFTPYSEPTELVFIPEGNTDDEAVKPKEPKRLTYSKNVGNP